MRKSFMVDKNVRMNIEDIEELIGNEWRERLQ
jgi:hypothetical protein